MVPRNTKQPRTSDIIVYVVKLIIATLDEESARTLVVLDVDG